MRTVPLFGKHLERHKGADQQTTPMGAASPPGGQPTLTQIRVETLGVIPRRPAAGLWAPMVSISAVTGRIAYAQTKRVCVYNVADLSGSEQEIGVEASGLSNHMTFSPSGRYLALARDTAATMGTPAYRVNGEICDLESGRCHTLYSGRIAGLAGTHGAAGIVIDPTDSLVAVGDLDEGLHVRRLEDWGSTSVPVVAVLKGWSSAALAWSADGTTLYHAGGRYERSSFVQRVNVLRCTSTSVLSFELAGSVVFPWKKPLRGFGLRGLAVAEEPGLLAVGGDKGADAIHVFDLARSTEVCQGATPKAATPFLRFSPDGDYLLGLSTDGTLRLWSIMSGAQGRILQPEGAQQLAGKVLAVDAWPGSAFDLFVVAAVDGAAYVYRVWLPVAG